MVATRSTTEPSAPASTDVAVRTEAATTDVVVGRTVHTRAWLRERIDGRVGLAVGIAWVVLMQIAFALEPASNHEVPVIGLLLELSMYALLATMVVGLVMQQRFGLVASLGAAVLATAASIACPVSGHHTFGSWWFGQMACVLALVAISAVALRRTPSDA
jgi:peptidoglycan/LPS O-acetylase OafA/YrhL